jgi:general secretion pathway protein F
MGVFQYLALNTTGREITGIIEADSPAAARRKLRDQGLHPVNVGEDAAPGVAAREMPFSFLRRRSVAEEVSLITRQLAVLLEAGMPLVDALSAILEQIDAPRLDRVVHEVRDNVRQGATLGDALAAHPKEFTDLYVNMVRAGESSGALEAVLFRLADHAENQIRVAKRIKSALVYPVVMCVFGLGIVAFLMGFVIPKISQVFESFGKDLPGITTFLIGTCNFIREYWWVGIVVLAGLALGLRQYIGTPSGRRRWDWLRLNAPVFGDLSRKLSVSRFARTLGTLVEGGLPMMAALDIVERVVQNVIIEEAVDEARKAVRRGHDLAMPLRESGLFSPMLVHMVALGERSGQLEKMLIRVADASEEEAQTKIDTLMTLLEPVIIIVMGLFVAFLVMAILLPILDMSQGLG